MEHRWFLAYPEAHHPFVGESSGALEAMPQSKR
jgi:hypothetical protein